MRRCCHATVVGRELVTIGGWVESAFRPTGEVNIYGVVTGAWRPGAPMPAPPTVFLRLRRRDRDRVRGLREGATKKKLSSDLAYDTAADAWVKLPDMSRPRDQCLGIFHGGNFRVIIDKPWRREELWGSMEEYDVAFRWWRWAFMKEPENAYSGRPRRRR